MDAAKRTRSHGTANSGQHVIVSNDIITATLMFARSLVPNNVLSTTTLSPSICAILPQTPLYSCRERRGRTRSFLGRVQPQEQMESLGHKRSDLERVPDATRRQRFVVRTAKKPLLNRTQESLLPPRAISSSSSCHWDMLEPTQTRQLRQPCFSCTPLNHCLM